MADNEEASDAEFVGVMVKVTDEEKVCAYN